MYGVDCEDTRVLLDDVARDATFPDGLEDWIEEAAGAPFSLVLARDSTRVALDDEARDAAFVDGLEDLTEDATGALVSPVLARDSTRVVFDDVARGATFVDGLDDLTEDAPGAPVSLVLDRDSTTGGDLAAGFNGSIEDTILSGEFACIADGGPMTDAARTFVEMLGKFVRDALSLE